MSRLPVIVGFGGYNAAGRSSFHHGYRRTVIDSLAPRARQETLAGLAVMMKLVKAVDGEYRDDSGTTLTPADIEARHAQRILDSTLVRRIEKQYLDVDAAYWQKNITVAGVEGAPLTFCVPLKQLPEPVPANWSVESISATATALVVAEKAKR